MQLQSKNAVQQCSILSVREIQNQPPIHVVLDMISLSPDDDVIPLIKLEELLILIRSDQRLLIQFQLLAFPFALLAHKDDSASAARRAAFVINKS